MHESQGRAFKILVGFCKISRRLFVFVLVLLKIEHFLKDSRALFKITILWSWQLFDDQGKLFDRDFVFHQAPSLSIDRDFIFFF